MQKNSPLKLWLMMKRRVFLEENACARDIRARATRTGPCCRVCLRSSRPRAVSLPRLNIKTDVEDQNAAAAFPEPSATALTLMGGLISPRASLQEQGFLLTGHTPPHQANRLAGLCESDNNSIHAATLHISSPSTDWPTIR
jgi:hypothetical protein